MEKSVIVVSMFQVSENHFQCVASLPKYSWTFRVKIQHDEGCRRIKISISKILTVRSVLLHPAADGPSIIGIVTAQQGSD